MRKSNKAKNSELESITISPLTPPPLRLNSMAVPYFNSHSLNPDAQKAYGAATLNSGSVLNDCSQRRGVVFGLGAQQAAANNYLNTPSPDGESYHNPFSDYRFSKVLVKVPYHQAPEQSEPLGSSNKTKEQQQSDENILHTDQSGFRIDRVRSMATKANSQSRSISANHSPLDSTLKDTAGNGSSGMGQSTPQISSVVDNTSQTVRLESKRRKASRKAYEQSDKGKATRKAYRQSDKGKASHKAYRESDKGKASSKACNQSDKWKAYQKAYRQSDKGKANQRAYKKAYREVFNKTGDREQAKIAGKQATAFMRKSNKAGNSELESISISPLTPRLSG